MREVLNRPTPLKKQKRRKALVNLSWVVLVLISIYFGIGALSHLPRININEVEARGLKALDSHEVSLEMLRYLEGNTALVYSRSNKFIYSKKDLTEFVLEKFPRIYRVNSIERGGQSLNVDIEERQAAYAWCGHEGPAYAERFTRKDCYFVDQKGFVFDTSPYFTDGVYMAVYGGLDKSIDVIGQTIGLGNSIEGVKNIADKLQETETPIHSLVMRADGQHEFLLDIRSSYGDFSRIIWNEDVTLEETFDKIMATLSEEEFIAEFDERSEDLLYIDTRFKNRVFYKFATPI
jgi:hypothetical protein